jgi:hypothetical protein
MNQINLYNVYDFVTYEHDLEKKLLRITWDKDNEAINRIMITECYQSHNKIRGFYWIDELKRITGWCLGDKILVIGCSHDNGWIRIYWVFNSVAYVDYNIIDSDGYFYKRDYNLDNHPFTKINCLYNDLMDDEMLPYILK